MTTNDYILSLKQVGSRGGATRVRVASPQGSLFDGQTGTIARTAPEGTTTVMVRLDRGGPDLPFGLGELEPLPVARPGR